MALNALFTGSSALHTFDSALDVIGNNLANLNTTGYKTQRAQFKDLLYQTVTSGSALTGNVGSINPQQLGFGVTVGAIDTTFSQGTSNATGRELDASIQGTGFFVVSDGTQNLYTRSGAFSVDSGNFLIDSNTGFRVQRFGNTGEGTATLPAFQTVGDSRIRIPNGATAQGSATTDVTFQGNLSTALAVGDSVSTAIQVYDSQSTSRTLTITFTKTAANTFDTTGTISGGTVTFGAGSTVTFDTAGLLVAPASLTATLNGLPAPQNVTLSLGTPGVSNGMTQFGGASTATATNQDGLGSGTLATVTIDQDGIVEGVFSNGRTIPIAQLAIASFNNENGLTREGNNYFAVSGASGEALIGPGGSGGRGIIQSGTLEGSNVDISTEFSRLIIAQRGFQVNSKTITTANEVLQTLANIIQ